MELSRSAYTVVVGNDDEDGLKARDLALQWHADGLLEEFAWVTPQDVHNASYGPATVMAQVIGKDEPTELMTLLGARPRSLVRIVVLHLLTHEDSSAVRLVDACNEIAELVFRAMPRQIANSDGPKGMRLLRINLMVPESDLLPQDTSLIEPGWEINAIVSPEDRPDLDRMSVFVRKSVNLHGHGLAAAAAVGGLWSDSNVGAFDNHQADSTTGGREVLVVRCQARMVVGDDRSFELAAKVVEMVQRSEMGAAPMVTWGIPADNPDAVAATSVQKLLLHPEWAPVERQPRPLEKTQVSLGTLLRNWAVFQLQMPIAALKYIFGLGRSAVEQAITAATVGKDAGEVGRVRPLTPDQAREVAEFRMKTLTKELDPARLQQEASSWGQTTPSAWRELRELAIGLVDGSRLPDRYSRTSRGGLPEVLAPCAVVPAPDDSLKISGQPELEGIDVERVAVVAQDLKDDEKAGTPSSETARAPGPDALSSPEAKAEASTKPKAKVSTADTAKPRKPAVSAPVEDGHEEPTDKERLTAWVDARKSSLMWQLASRVYEFRRRENSQVQVAQTALTNDKAPSTSRLQLAQVLVVISWFLTLLGAIFMGFWIWAEARENPIAFLERLPDLNWQNIAKLVVVILIALLAAGMNYFQALRAYEWQVAVRMHALRQASDEYVIASQQEKRWTLMYRGVQDWGQILSELLHRPWAESTTDEGHMGEYAELPASVAVAKPVDVDAGSDPRLVTKGVEAVCQRGWLAEEFERLVAHSPHNDPAAQPHAGALPADLDLGLRSNGPRTELVHVASMPTTKAAATEHLVEEVTELVKEGDVAMPAQKVERLGQYSAGDKVVDQRFFSASTDVISPFTAELFQPAALVARYNIPERTVLCLPMGSPEPRLENVEVHYCGVSVATRVDISPQMQPDNIRLFERAQRFEVTPMDDVDSFN